MVGKKYRSKMLMQVYLRLTVVVEHEVIVYTTANTI
jgi:hypothetical protein